MSARAVLTSTTGTAPITFVRTRDGVRIELEDGSAQVYAVADVNEAMLAATLFAHDDTPAPVRHRAHPGWANVNAVEFYLATKARPYLAAVLDDMASDPADVAAALRGVAAVIDGGAR